MKQIQLLLTAILLMPLIGLAQVQNCGFAAGAGGTISSTQTEVCPPDLFLPLSFTGTSVVLDRTDYVFFDCNDTVYSIDSATAGPRILEINTTGVFDPASAGLVDGDQFGVTAFSWDLSSLQSTIEEILTGTFIFSSCCDLAALAGGFDVCSTYNACGITSGTDILDLQDVVDFIVCFGGTPSLDNVLFTLEEFNAQAGQPCTDGLPICYASSNTLKIDVSCPPMVCDASAAPDGLGATIGASSVQLAWNPIPLSVGCQVNGGPVGVGGGGASLNILGFEASSANVPLAALNSGTTYQFRIRCACSLSPIVVTPFSSYANFTAPAARVGIEVKDLVYANGSLHFNAVQNEIANTTQNVSTAASFEIYDLSGKLMQATQAELWENNRIELPALSTGIYLLRVKTADAIATQKFELW